MKDAEKNNYNADNKQINKAKEKQSSIGAIIRFVKFSSNRHIIS